MRIPLRLLMVEDSADDAALILRELRKGGLVVEARRVESPGAMAEALREGEWDLVISDYHLPEFEALAPLRMFLSHGLDIPFVMVSGVIGEEAAVAAVKAGAHDYVLKGNPARLCLVIERELHDAETRRERKRDKTALKASQARLEKALEMAQMGSWEWDISTNQKSWSQQPYQVLGLEDLRAPKTYDDYIELIHPEDRPRVLGTIEETLAEGQAMQLDYRIVLPSGEIQFIHELAEVVRDEDGRPRRLWGIAQNVTRRRRMETELLDLERMSAKGQMAAYIAHEINNPLAGIKNAFLLLEDAVPKDHPHWHYAGLIKREIDRIAGIIRTMYHVYRSYPQESRDVPLDAAFDDIASLMIPKCRAHGVELSAEITEPTLCVRANEGMLRQVLFNLVQNAVEASPRDSVITLGAWSRQNDVFIFIRDQGAGIPAELSKRIFESGFTTKRDSGLSGLGLGLSTCKSMVESMNGGLDFAPAQDGPGTIFQVRLPACPLRDQKTNREAP